MSGTITGPGWRADVRSRVATILDDQVPEVKGRVYRARVWPVGQKPALLVYGYAEQKRLKGQGGYQHIFDVTCGMVVRVLCEGVAPPRFDRPCQIEEQCERIAGQVERAILRSPLLFTLEPHEGGIRLCSAVTTQLSAEQKERNVEVEATIEFQLAWEEVFTMAEPESAPCEGVDYRPSSTLIPTP